MFSKMLVKSCKCEGSWWQGTGPTAESSQSTLCRETSTSGTTAGCGHRSRAQQKRGSGSHNEFSLDSNRGQILGTLLLSGCKLKRLFSRNAPWILSDDCNHGDLSPFVSHASWLTKFLYFSKVNCSLSMMYFGGYPHLMYHHFAGVMCSRLKNPLKSKKETCKQVAISEVS